MTQYNLATRNAMFNLIDNSRSDKNTWHSYLGLYERLFFHKRESAKKVLEIGIHLGGSIKLWRDYFTNAQIYAMDIVDEKQIWDVLKLDSRIKLYTSSDAYSEEFFAIFASEHADEKFDIIIDDGSHRPEDMKQVIKLYSSLLADDGILIIEDLENYQTVDALKSVVPEHLKNDTYIYDLRCNKHRYDDMAFVIDRAIGKLIH